MPRLTPSQQAAVERWRLGPPARMPTAPSPAPQRAPLFDDAFDWWMVLAVFTSGAVVGGILTGIVYELLVR